MNFYNLIPGFIRRKLEGRNDLIKILKNCSWLSLHHAVQLIFGLLVGILVARYLGPSRYGVLNFVLSFIVLFEPLAKLGLNHILTRDIVKYPDKEKEILGSAFFMRLGAGIVTKIIIIISIFLLKPDEKDIILYVIIMAVSSLFNSFNIIEFWFLAKVQSKYIVISQISVTVIVSLIKVVLLYTKASLTAFVIVSALEKILIGVGFIIVYHIKNASVFKWKFNKELAVDLLSQSWPLILSGFAGQIYLKIDQVMLMEMTTKAESGIYAAAARLSELWYFLPTIIAGSIFPSLVEMKEKDTDAYNKRLQKFYNLFAVLGMGLSVLVCLLSRYVIGFIYGKEFAPSSYILSIHIWASVFIFMQALLSKWFIAEKLYFFSLSTHVAGALTNVILNIILIPKYGGVGAAVATVISYAAASYLPLFFHQRTKATALMMTRALISPFTGFFSWICKAGHNEK